MTVESLRHFASLQRQLSLPVIQSAGHLFLLDGHVVYQWLSDQ